MLPVASRPCCLVVSLRRRPTAQSWSSESQPSSLISVISAMVSTGGLTGVSSGSSASYCGETSPTHGQMRPASGTEMRARVSGTPAMSLTPHHAEVPLRYQTTEALGALNAGRPADRFAYQCYSRAIRTLVESPSRVVHSHIGVQPVPSVQILAVQEMAA